MDSLTTMQEVQEALQRELKELTGELKVSLTKANSRSQKMAIIEINERAHGASGASTMSTKRTSARVRKGRSIATNADKRDMKQRHAHLSRSVHYAKK